MRRNTKIAIGVSLGLLAVVLFEIMYGLHLMAVEQRYGHLQNVYFLSESGDVILDNNQRVGFIRKKARRIYVEEGGAKIDLCDWVSGSKEQPVEFAVYSLDTPEALPLQPSYEEVVALVEGQNLQPVISY